MERLLWEVQTLAANLDGRQLEKVRQLMRTMLGSDYSDEVIADWEHELEEG